MRVSQELQHPFKLQAVALGEQKSKCEAARQFNVVTKRIRVVQAKGKIVTEKSLGNLQRRD